MDWFSRLLLYATKVMRSVQINSFLSFFVCPFDFPSSYMDKKDNTTGHLILFFFYSIIIFIQYKQSFNIFKHLFIQAKIVNHFYLILKWAWAFLIVTPHFFCVRNIFNTRKTSIFYSINVIRLWVFLANWRNSARESFKWWLWGQFYYYFITPL